MTGRPRRGGRGFRIAGAAGARLLSLVCCLAGCAHAPAPDNPFASLQRLREVEGVYANAGEGRRKAPSLWAVLVPSRGQETVADAVELRVTDAGDLRLRALSAGRVVDEAHLSAGRDFSFAQGCVAPPPTQTSAVVGAQNAGIAWGVCRESLLLGLDANGDLKTLRSARFTGCVLCFVPLTRPNDEEVRYRRLPQGSTGSLGGDRAPP